MYAIFIPIFRVGLVKFELLFDFVMLFFVYKGWLGGDDKICILRNK